MGRVMKKVIWHICFPLAVLGSLAATLLTAIVLGVIYYPLVRLYFRLGNRQSAP